MKPGLLDNRIEYATLFWIQKPESSHTHLLQQRLSNLTLFLYVFKDNQFGLTSFSFFLCFFLSLSLSLSLFVSHTVFVHVSIYIAFRSTGEKRKG